MFYDVNVGGDGNFSMNLCKFLFAKNNLVNYFYAIIKP